MRRFSTLVLTVLLTGGCGGPSAQTLARAPAFEPEGQTKCGVMRSQSRPLIVEWPAADRSALESQARRGLVAVRYVGCEMEVLRQCTVPGAYRYGAVTRKDDRVSMRTADELYAAIPVHAAAFEGKLATSGELRVEMTIVGTYDASVSRVRADELTGSCEGATHFIASITAGAFEFSAGAAAQVGAGVSGLGAAAGARESASRELLNRDGDRAACAAATTADLAPPEGCGAMLRVEVEPVGAAESTAMSGLVAKPAPGAAAPGGVMGGVMGTNFEYVPARWSDPQGKPSRSQEGSLQRTLGGTAITLGSLSAAVGLVTGLVALTVDSKLDAACTTDGRCPSDQTDRLDSLGTLSGVTTGTLIGATLGIAGGITLVATSPDPYAKKSGGAEIKVGPGGAALAGRF